MKQEYQQLYKEMLTEIERCMQTDLSEMERVENCYWTADDYWEKLKELIKQSGFKSKEDEINFFKNIKPQFTSYIEYFLVLSEALLFALEEEKEAIDFWKKQGERFRRFCEKNEDFVSYYKKGLKMHDEIFFLRRNSDREYRWFTAHVYDMDPGYFTSKDHLARSYLAFKMFNKYVKEKLKSISC